MRKSRSTFVRRKIQESTVCSAAGRSRSGPLTDWTFVLPEAPTEKSTSTAPCVPVMRAKGGTTGRRPRARSGTPDSARTTSRMAELPVSAGSGGGGAEMTSTGGGAAFPGAAGALGAWTGGACGGVAGAGRAGGAAGVVVGGAGGTVAGAGGTVAGAGGTVAGGAAPGAAGVVAGGGATLAGAAGVVAGGGGAAATVVGGGAGALVAVEAKVSPRRRLSSLSATRWGSRPRAGTNSACTRKEMGTPSAGDA